MNKQELNIGLFGFGCVGYGLYQVLGKTSGIQASIKKVCIKHPEKSRPVKESFFTVNPSDILDDPSINIVVELTDDADAAFAIVKQALERGKAVVTANKKMVSEHFAELIQLQKLYNVPVLYEAAACASIPIIRNLEEYYDNDTLSLITGIVNGSTNYILSRALNEGLSFDNALQIAQSLGYAESNPSLDVDAWDAAYKLQILCAHAFGVVLDAKDIARIGIRSIGEAEFQYAREKNYKIKLLAKAFKSSETSISAFVMPTFVSSESPLFGVDDVFNGVLTETAFADRQFFSGKGAGAYPTASAVLSDISALSYKYQYEYKKINRVEVPDFTTDVLIEAYIRVPLELVGIALSVFDEIHERHQDIKGAYLIGLANLRFLNDFVRNFPEASVVVLNTLSESVKVFDLPKLQAEQV
jgi:homoserine dehydrogenase